METNITIKAKWMPKSKVDNFYVVTIMPPKSVNALYRESIRFMCCTVAPQCVVEQAVVACTKQNYEIEIKSLGAREWYMFKGYKNYKEPLSVGSCEWETLETLCAEVQRLQFILTKEITEEKTIIVKSEREEEV